VSGGTGNAGSSKSWARAFVRTCLVGSLGMTGLVAVSARSVTFAQNRTPSTSRGTRPPSPKKTKPVSAPSGSRGGEAAAADAGEHLSARGETTTPTAGVATASSTAVDAGAAAETRVLDGGTRVFRFGELEIEGRLRNPNLVYFLRRVRAEFAAGDLGHRTFMRELSETRKEPAF
jgi:hypothetical protein